MPVRKATTGGKTKSPGRPRGSTNSMSQKARTAAKLTGKLPHEILLDAARGECFKVKQLVITYYRSGPNRGDEKSREWIVQDYYPTYAERMDAAKSAAPYYAPRLASQTIDAGKNATESLSAVMKELSGKLPG